MLQDVVLPPRSDVEHSPAPLSFNIDEIIRPAWSSHHLNIKELGERGNMITNMRSKNEGGSNIFDINRLK